MVTMAGRPGPVARRALRVPGYLFDLRLGPLLGRRFLRLTHTGRRTGAAHTAVLEVLGVDRDVREVYVLAALGHRADWLRNLRAGGEAAVELGGHRFRADHRVLDEAEAAAVVGHFERQHRLAAPVARRLFAALTGEPYDGSREAAQRLVRACPVVGLRPAGRPVPGGAAVSD